MSTPVLDVIREVKGPRPLLSSEAERALTVRQREVLDELHDVFADGFAHLTMGEIATAAQCSLRTLYDLAPSKSDLVRLVVDRHLWAIGRRAIEAVQPDMTPIDAIRAHLHAAHMAVADTTEALAADASADRVTDAIQRSHAQYLIDVTRALLDEAVSRGEIDAIDTAAVARVMANVGADFASPTVLTTLRSSAKQAADTVVDLLLSGLTARDLSEPSGALSARQGSERSTQDVSEPSGALSARQGSERSEEERTCN